MYVCIDTFRDAHIHVYIQKKTDKQAKIADIADVNMFKHTCAHTVHARTHTQTYTYAYTNTDRYTYIQACVNTHAHMSRCVIYT